jgi:D-3-phosphoglycerate dehydrogenase
MASRIRLDVATARGVMVSNIPGGNAQSVAEYCAMALLMLARNILAITNTLRQSTWDVARAVGADAHEIAGMTLGIVAEPASLDALVSASDFVVLANAWLINVGRGPVVEESALIQALRDRIAPGHALFALDKVVLTPHLSGMTRASRARMSVAAAEDMLRMLAGERPRHWVNPQ